MPSPTATFFLIFLHSQTAGLQIAGVSTQLSDCNASIANAKAANVADYGMCGKMDDWSSTVPATVTPAQIAAFKAAHGASTNAGTSASTTTQAATPKK